MRAIKMQVIVVAIVVGLGVVSQAPAYYAGGGKDAAKGDDCLVGYEFVDPGQVTDAGTKKPAVVCVDCDPSCDLDGVPTANGSCTMAAGVCIDQSGVAQCTPPSGLDKASAKGKVQGVKGATGKIVIDTSQLLEGSACGAMVGVVMPLKSTKKGLKERKATIKLSALVKKNKSEGISKRTDKDKLTYICQPRPEGEACPSATTTSTSSTTSSTAIASTTSTTVVTSTSTTTTVTSSTTTTTSIPTTTSTTVPTTTNTSTTTTTSTTTSTIIPALCGNDTVDAGETCDDGSNLDNDACPADCFIGSCSPDTGTARLVTVAFDAPAGVNVAGLTLFLNYPEQKVFLPPAGPNASLGSPSLVRLYPTSQVTLLAADLGTAGIDSGYAVRALMGSLNPVPHGPIFQLTFQDCMGAAAPIPGDFNCTVLSATDPGSNPLGNVTCYAMLP